MIKHDSLMKYLDEAGINIVEFFVSVMEAEGSGRMTGRESELVGFYRAVDADDKELMLEQAELIWRKSQKKNQKQKNVKE